MSEFLKGEIAGITEKRVTAKGWVTSEITFTDGSVKLVTIPPSIAKINTGDTIECKVGQYNNWQVFKINGKEDRLEPKNTEIKGTAASSSDHSSPAAAKKDYWQEKASYEEKVRDPKIESQFYFAKVLDIYAAAIPVLEQPPTTPDEVDAYIDQAFDKAKALYKLVNKPKKEE